MLIPLNCPALPCRHVLQRRIVNDRRGYSRLGGLHRPGERVLPASSTCRDRVSNIFYGNQRLIEELKLKLEEETRLET